MYLPATLSTTTGSAEATAVTTGNTTATAFTPSIFNRMRPPAVPIVGTGMEHKICIDSEIAVLAEGDGVVTSVDARHVTVKYDSGETKDYKLTKFLRSNHTTCINATPKNAATHKDKRTRQPAPRNSRANRQAPTPAKK